VGVLSVVLLQLGSASWDKGASHQAEPLQVTALQKLGLQAEAAACGAGVPGSGSGVGCGLAGVGGGAGVPRWAAAAAIFVPDWRDA